MKTLHDVTVGDTIFMVCVATGDERPTFGQEVEGVVVTTKRINLTVRAVSGSRLWTVRRDSRKATTARIARGWRGYTADEFAASNLQHAADAFLARQHIILGMNSPWQSRKAELADLIRNHLEAPPHDDLG